MEDRDRDRERQRKTDRQTDRQTSDSLSHKDNHIWAQKEDDRVLEENLF